MKCVCGVCGEEIAEHERIYKNIRTSLGIEQILLPHAKCIELKKAEMRKHDEENLPKKKKRP